MKIKTKNQNKAGLRYLIFIPCMTMLILFLSPTKMSGFEYVLLPENKIISDTLPIEVVKRKNTSEVTTKEGKYIQMTPSEFAAPPPPPEPPTPPAPPQLSSPNVKTTESSTEKMDIDEMPRFNNEICEALVDVQQKENCSKGKLMEYIAANLQYPDLAKENNIDGMVVAKFMVTTEGKINQIQILKDPGSGCGDAVKFLLLSMNEESNLWVPGIHKGKKVDVEYTIPVRFKMN